jgi:hypothetical protein
VIAEATEFGARTARHLREEIVVWMTTALHFAAHSAANCNRVVRGWANVSGVIPMRAMCSSYLATTCRCASG